MWHTCAGKSTASIRSSLSRPCAAWASCCAKGTANETYSRQKPVLLAPAPGSLERGGWRGQRGDFSHGSGGGRNLEAGGARDCILEFVGSGAGHHAGFWHRELW